jgi:NADH-ubiquinone oxidoreductase chain 6
LNYWCFIFFWFFNFFFLDSSCYILKLLLIGNNFLNLIFFKIIVLLSFNIFIIFSHPLLLRLLLILITLSIIVRIFNSSFNIWFSFILCLIYLGGVLILFIYISSFLPNEKFFSIRIFSILVLWRLLFVLIFRFNIFERFFSIVRNRITNFNLLFLINKISLLRFAIFYLIFVLLISVYYSSFRKIPLRRIY